MKILNFGSMNIDNVYSVDHIAVPGETLTVREKNVFCGGKGLNQSIAIAKAGGQVWHAGITGEDGGMLLAALENAGVNTCNVKKAAGESAHTVIQVDKNGQNSIIVFSGENVRPSEKDIDGILAGFESGDLLVLQNELYNSPLMMKKAAEKGMKIVFNPSPCNDSIFEYPLESVSWFILNEIEGAALSGGETQPERILEKLGKKYPGSNAVLTLGEKGAYCAAGGKTVFQRAFPVKAVDTTAAGDSFLGYFVAGLAEELPMEENMRRAALAASVAVSREGAAVSIPELKEIENLE